jgi:hypothetical protein
LFDWWERERNRADGRARASRLLALLVATGDVVPESLARSLLDGPAQLATTVLDPAFDAQIARAARAGRVGETVLLSMVGLGQDGPEAINTSGLGTVVGGLRAIGLDADARALAVEAMAAAP